MIFKIIDVLKPVLYGCVIAYLLNPIVKRVDAFLIPKLQERMKKPEKAENVSRSVGIFVSLIILNCVDYAIIKYADTGTLQQYP